MSQGLAKCTYLALLRVFYFHMAKCSAFKFFNITHDEAYLSCPWKSNYWGLIANINYQKISQVHMCTINAYEHICGSCKLPCIAITNWRFYGCSRTLIRFINQIIIGTFKTWFKMEFLVSNVALVLHIYTASQWDLHLITWQAINNASTVTNSNTFHSFQGLETELGLMTIRQSFVYIFCHSVSA